MIQKNEDQLRGFFLRLWKTGDITLTPTRTGGWKVVTARDTVRLTDLVRIAGFFETWNVNIEGDYERGYYDEISPTVTILVEPEK